MKRCLWNKELTRGQVIMNPEMRKRLDCGKDCIKQKECMNQIGDEQ